MIVDIAAGILLALAILALWPLILGLGLALLALVVLVALLVGVALLPPPWPGVLLVGFLALALIGSIDGKRTR